MVDMVEPTTTIRIKKSTKRRLESLGRMGDSFDSLINRIIDEHRKEKTRPRRSGLKTLMVGPRDAPQIPLKEPSVEEVVEVLSKPTWKDVLRVSNYGS